MVSGLVGQQQIRSSSFASSKRKPLNNASLSTQSLLTSLRLSTLWAGKHSGKFWKCTAAMRTWWRLSNSFMKECLEKSPWQETSVKPSPSTMVSNKDVCLPLPCSLFTLLQYWRQWEPTSSKESSWRLDQMGRCSICPDWKPQARPESSVWGNCYMQTTQLWSLPTIKTYKRLWTAATLFSLKINVSKTELLYQPSPDEPSECQEVLVNGDALKKSSHFTYLGSAVTDTNSADL